MRFTLTKPNAIGWIGVNDTAISHDAVVAWFKYPETAQAFINLLNREHPTASKTANQLTKTVLPL